MKAAVLREVGKPLQIENISISKPGPHEVLIRTVAAGVCHSDLHFVEGSYPHPLPAVLGHESAGVVEQIGSEVGFTDEGEEFWIAVWPKAVASRVPVQATGDFGGAKRSSPTGGAA